MPLCAPPPIEAPRVVLRLVAEADLADLMAVNGDDAVTRFLPYATWKSMDDAKAWFDRMAGIQATGTALQFVVVLRETGKAIGTCLLFRYEEKSARAELGWVMGREHWGRGLMREALAALIDFAFGTLGLRRLEAEVNPRNEASLALAQRLGFTREGLLREKWLDKDAPVSVYAHGLLRREWPAPAATRREPPFKSVAYDSLAPGTRLVVLGAVHGNETCGTRAIERILGEIDSGALAIAKGSVTFVPVANPLAYAKRERAGERNLNRNLFPKAAPSDFEDRVANALCPLLARHDALLDLHSTRGRTQPFALVGPRDNDGKVEPFKRSREERALAKRLGVTRFVEGWLDTYARGVERRVREGRAGGLNTDARYGVGTTEYMRSVGGYAITLECGQHDDPTSVEVAYRAIRNTLAFLGHVREEPPPAVERYEALRIREVIDRADPADAFAREWASFDALAPGDVIAHRHDGKALTAPAAGRILFPDVGAKPGNEWYYLAETAAEI